MMELSSTLKYVLDILQTEEAFTVEEYTHTTVVIVTKAYDHYVNKYRC